jgi:hypothetical protein
MAFKMRTLIVEDDPNEQDSWNQVIELHNVDAEAHGFEIVHQTVATLAEARRAISIGNYDAAVVDIRLKQENGNAAPNTDGNDVLTVILESEMAVVAIFTGEAAMAMPPNDLKQVVGLFTKGGGDGEGTSAVVGWLKEQAPMVRHIQDAQTVIRQEMASIFAKSIWPRWTHWALGGTSTSLVSAAITRHITSHIYAALLEKGRQEAHPEEWYFVPPIREGIRTGDLIRIEGGPIEIVITPRCDLARDTKNETIQLALCEDVSEEWARRRKTLADARALLAESQLPAGDKERTRLEAKVTAADNHLRQFTQHRNNTNLHFLPQMKLSNSTVGPLMVRFDSIRSVPRNSDEAKVKMPKSRIAALTPEFLPSLVERLGAYFSRIGTPDYSHPD